MSITGLKSLTVSRCFFIIVSCKATNPLCVKDVSLADGMMIKMVVVMMILRLHCFVRVKAGQPGHWLSSCYWQAATRRLSFCL